MAGRYLAVGDIHGCAVAFDALLTRMAPQSGDVVVTLGDYVDRGPDSRGVLDRLIRFDEDYPDVELIPLRGNHEVMMTEARDAPDRRSRWLSYGGDATLASYGEPGEAGSLDAVPAGHWTFLDEWLHAYHESADFLFVHANLLPDLPLHDQPDYMLYWEPLPASPPRHQSGKRLICGHTSQRSGRPRATPNAVCIDTNACRGGWLSGLCPETGEVWQANERGESRTLRLDEL